MRSLVLLIAFILVGNISLGSDAVVANDRILTFKASGTEYPGQNAYESMLRYGSYWAARECERRFFSGTPKFIEASNCTDDYSVHGAQIVCDLSFECQSEEARH